MTPPSGNARASSCNTGARPSGEGAASNPALRDANAPARRARQGSGIRDLTLGERDRIALAARLVTAASNIGERLLASLYVRLLLGGYDTPLTPTEQARALAALERLEEERGPCERERLAKNR